MSIINQTLRELDARKGGALPPQTPSRPAAAPLRRRLGFWVAAGTVLPAAGVLVWFMSRPADVVPEPRAVPAPQVMSSAPIVPTDVVATAPRPEPVQPAEAPILIPTKPAVVAAQAEVRPRTVKAAVPLGPSLAMTLSAGANSPQAISKEINKPTAEEDADERYRRAVGLLQKGRETQARTLLDEAVRLSPRHAGARQILATLLSEAGQNHEAERLLREGRVILPDNAWFALSLARLQASRGDVDGAAATLQSGVGGQGVNADYHATLAALLVQLKQHPEAARHYEQALKLQPDQGIWWMGLGLAWAAQGKHDEARTAYRHALSTGTLPEKLVAFVHTKLAK